MFVSRKSRASVRRLPSAVPRVRCRCRIVSLLSELKILGPLPCVSKALQQLKRLRRWLPRASDRVRNFSRALTGRFQSNTPTFCFIFLCVFFFSFFFAERYRRAEEPGRDFTAEFPAVSSPEPLLGPFPAGPVGIGPIRVS